jgi:hypothetical protein
LQAIAGLTMETNADGEPEPVAAWVAFRRADGPWTLLDPPPISGKDVLAISAIGVTASGSVDVIATGWDGDCGGWARWTDGAGWTGLQPVPGCPDDPGIVEGRDGTPVVLTYDGEGDFEYAIAVGSVTTGR